jgi:hypothetical protein
MEATGGEVQHAHQGPQEGASQTEPPQALWHQWAFALDDCAFPAAGACGDSSVQYSVKLQDSEKGPRQDPSAIVEKARLKKPWLQPRTGRSGSTIAMAMVLTSWSF